MAEQTDSAEVKRDRRVSWRTFTIVLVLCAGITFVLAFLASYVFGMFLGEHPSMALGLGAGAAAGIFWVAGSLWTNDLFERRPFALTVINGGYHIVKFVLIGLSFALIP